MWVSELHSGPFQNIDCYIYILSLYVLCVDAKCVMHESPEVNAVALPVFNDERPALGPLHQDGQGHGGVPRPHGGVQARGQ